MITIFKLHRTSGPNLGYAASNCYPMEINGALYHEGFGNTPDQAIERLALLLGVDFEEMEEAKVGFHERLTVVALAIVHLQEIGELSESQACSLMHSGDIVSYRMTRRKLELEMREALRADAKTHGWDLLCKDCSESP